MLQGFRWDEFLHRGDNKENLIAIISDSLQSPEGRSKLPCPFIVTSKEHTFRIDSLINRLIFDCNQEETDTRLVLHTILSGQGVVVASKDTDVLILLEWVYSSDAAVRTEALSRLKPERTDGTGPVRSVIFVCRSRPDGSCI